jgi:hypothetical protein
MYFWTPNWHWYDQLVIEALMASLKMVMIHLFKQAERQRRDVAIQKTIHRYLVDKVRTTSHLSQ